MFCEGRGEKREGERGQGGGRDKENAECGRKRVKRREGERKFGRWKEEGKGKREKKER